MKQLSTITAYRAILRFYHTNRIKIKFKRLRKLSGQTWIYGKPPYTILLDPKESILSTFIHELLHLTYPDNDEKWVARYESRITNKISICRYKRLLAIINNELNPICIKITE